MLYVFHVDTGLMLTFDMNLAMESVSKLQEAISSSYNIPPDKQVMLISGGENLDPSARVCSYSAGTDTNPIFLFSRTTIESATPPSASVNYGSDTGLQDQVEGSLNMGPTYETVVARAQLALQIHDVGREELRVCERLVHDQHLQHQGWAAVVANLEDITSAFKKRSEALWVSFDEFVGSRDRYISMLDNFDHTMELLRKIPLLPCLTGEHHRLWTPERNSAASSTPSDSTTAGSTTAGSSSTLSINKSLPHDSSTCSANLPIDPDSGDLSTETLLEWISAQDSRSSLENMIQQCQQGMQQFTTDVKEQLIADMHTLLEAVNNPNMKEVKGLEDRLYGLEQLMYGARKLVQEQNEMAQGFVQNQNRASNLRDTSVLPDLCQSHKRQLLVMLKNHQSLRDIRRRCTAAKDELAANLHTRLRWIMYVEKSLCDKDNKLMIHQATLRKLKRRLAVLQQMADAPSVYARAVVEVVRRKAFSENFLQWANTLASESLEIHEAEVGKREEFYSCIERHFLKSLFPGLDDVPVPYATKAPFVFDTKLPPITSDDISFLRSKVPELAEKLTVPEEDESVDKLTDLTTNVVPGGGKLFGGIFTTLATTLQNTLQTTVQTASQATLKSSGQSLGEGGSQASRHDDGTVTSTATEGASAAPGSAAKDDMCTSDIVVLTHEMSLQASEGGTLTDAGTVCLASTKPAAAVALGVTTVAGKDGAADSGNKVSPASPARSDLNQSVEVLGEEEEEEEEEFLSLQAEVPPEAAREGTEPAVVAAPPPQPVVVVEPKLKNSTSGSSAEMVPRGGSSGSLRTLAPSPTKLERREQHKSTPDTSPSLEEVNSEGFTTADFYIDESMPSSMTESPPTKKMVAELQMVLQDKSAQLDAKERDLEQHRRTLESARERLSRAEENMKILHDTAEKGTLQLKCDVLGMEKQIARDKDEFSNYMESVAKRLLAVIEKFEKQQSDEQRMTFEAMKMEKDSQIAELTKRLEMKTQKLSDAQSEIDLYNKQLKDRDDKCHSLAAEMSTKLNDMEVQWHSEVEDTRKGLMLEHEIEIERSQAEHKAEIERKEALISTLTQDLKEMEDEAQQQVEELTEKLKADFETERKDLVEKIEKEYQEKKETLEQEIRELLSKTHQVELETLKEKHEQHVKAECDRLNEELLNVKLVELDKLREESEIRLEEAKMEWKTKAEADLSCVQKEKDKALKEQHDQHTETLEEKEVQHKQEIADLETQHKELLAGVDRQHEQALSEVASEHQIALRELVNMHEKEIAELHEKLVLEKLNELQSLQQHFEEESYAQTEAKPQAVAEVSSITLEKHQEFMAKYKERLENEKSAALEQALSEQRKLHEAATERLVEQLDKEKPDSSSSSSSISAAAEKQIAFNEALSKVVAEKDKIIEELKARESLLSQQHEEDQRKLAEFLAGNIGEDAQRDAAVKLARDREEQLRRLMQVHEEELATSQAQVRALQEHAHMTTSGASSGSVISAASSPLKVAGQASAPLSQSVFSQSAMASSIMPFSEPSCSVSMYERIHELETNLKTKEEEMAEMNQKLRLRAGRARNARPPSFYDNGREMQMSMSTSARAFVQDKVSITTCNVGDVVLLCLDERHDHYVVFNMGTTLHFLHSDCLDTLGLKTSGAEARKSWVLAEITDKEYCQAKKAQNRFRVPLGTKFYRVKARPWDREAALHREVAAQRDSPNKSGH